MSITLRNALDETMMGWKQALPKAWRPIFKNTSLNSAGVPNKWKHDPWVPIFPVFKDHRTGEVVQAKSSKTRPNLIGIPPFAHTFRALLVPPGKVRVIIVGQDPYPDIADATGQSFEQGNLRDWIQDSNRVAGSLKPILKLAAAAHTGDQRYAKPKTSKYNDPGWNMLIKALATGDLKLASPDRLFPAYQKQGVLWLNTTLSISLFRVPSKMKRGYQYAHAEYWKPFMSKLLESVVTREDKHVVFGLWGTWAKSFKLEIKNAAKKFGASNQVRFVEAGHPVTDAFLKRKMNVFTEINDHLVELSSNPINWFPK